MGVVSRKWAWLLKIRTRKARNSIRTPPSRNPGSTIVVQLDRLIRMLRYQHLKLTLVIAMRMHNGQLVNSYSNYADLSGWWVAK